MNFDARRLGYSIAVGIALTLLAGYVGFLMFPLPFLGWLMIAIGSILSIFKDPSLRHVTFIVSVFLAPGVAGAYFAWPVTCIILPLAAALWRPATERMRWVLLCLGAAAGGLAIYAMTYAVRAKHWMAVSGGRTSYYLAGVAAGAVCGFIFGRAMWRYDQRRAAETRDAVTT